MTRMDLTNSSFIALFDTQNNIKKEYCIRANNVYVRMIFTHSSQLQYLLGENWDERKWFDIVNDQHIPINHLKIIFCSDEEVLIIPTHSLADTYIDRRDPR